MKPYFDTRVPAAPSAISSVRGALADLGMPARTLDDARLLVSELLTNCIRHAGLAPDDLVRVRAEWTGTRLRVDLWDRTGAAAPSPPPAPHPDGESGWGLYLVDSMAAQWGAAPGWHWFELAHDDGANDRGPPA